MNRRKTYPLCLIPHSGLKAQINLQEILLAEQERVCYAARRSQEAIKYDEEAKLNDGILIIANLDQCIPNHEVDRGLSMNVIQENVEEVLFRYQNDERYWDGTTPNINEEKDRLSFLSNNDVSIYDAKLLFSEINGRIADVNNDLHLEEIEQAIAETMAGNENITRLVHKPTAMNYWHFEFTIFNKNGEQVKYKRKSQTSKDLFNLIRTTYLSKCIEYNKAQNIDYSPYIKLTDIAEEDYLRRAEEVRIAADGLDCECIE